MEHVPIEELHKLGKNIEDWKNQNRWLWGHIILVNATILGFTVGTTQIKNIVEPNLFLVLSWILLLGTVFLGILLLHEDQDIKFTSDLNSFEFKYNMAEIEGQYSEGKINAEQRRGLILATMAENELIQLTDRGIKFTQVAKNLIEKYKTKLPTKIFISPIPGKSSKWKNPVKIWLYKNHINLSNWFYYLSLAAYLSLFLSVITGPYTKVWFPHIT